MKVGLTTLQKQLQEKEEEIKQLTLQREEAKISFRREENLIMSAFYDIGLDMQSKIMTGHKQKQRSASWLAR